MSTPVAGGAVAEREDPHRINWVADAVTGPHPWERVLQARALLFDIQADVAWLAAWFARLDQTPWFDWPDNAPRPPEPEAERMLVELRQAVGCWSNIAVAARASVYGRLKDAQGPELVRLGLVPAEPRPREAETA